MNYRQVDNFSILNLYTCTTQWCFYVR